MTRTAVAAPAAEPFDELFAAIDAMDGATLRRFLVALRGRFDVPLPQPTVTVTVSGVGFGANKDATVWTRNLEAWGWH